MLSLHESASLNILNSHPLNLLKSMITGTSVVVWVVCALLAAGVAWSRYEKKKTRDKFLRELAAMDPERREKLLNRLSPKLATELREHLMERFRLS
jgi:hypothetical protein